MKTIKQIITFTICLAAALLTSCIKEDVAPAQTRMLEVNLTRSDSDSSSQQGDQIQDIMLWAFDASDNYALVGWKTYTPDAPTYKNISVHLPVKMCGENGGTYRVVAVINKGLFTDGSGNAIPLDASTTYEQLINGRFVSETVMNSSINNAVSPATPEAMPITHWCAVSVNQNNLHAQGDCVVAPLTVFRTVAKTQFSIARSSNFNLKIKELSICSNAMPQEGLILSAAHAANLELHTATPSWFGSNKPETAPALSSINLLSAPVDVTAAANSQQLIGARFLYENDQVCSYANDGVGVPTGDGYYYKITYSIDGGADVTRYVGIDRAVVRNHDYLVQAKVQADGSIQASYTVAEWEEVEWNIDFAHPVHTELLTAPSTAALAPTVAPTLYYDNSNPEAGAFVGYFKMDSPAGVTWKPTLSNASADHYSIKVYSNLDAEGNALGGFTREVTGNISAKADAWYKIMVIADSAESIGEYPKLAITYKPGWNPSATPLLIINKGSEHNGLYYPFADWSAPVGDLPDMFWISIKQVAKP